jgi:hypothetical protein
MCSQSWIVLATAGDGAGAAAEPTADRRSKRTLAGQNRPERVIDENK